MITGKISNGFEFEIEEEIRDDMEFVELLAETETDITALPKLVTILLGNDKKRELYDLLRNEKGRVQLTAVSDAISEIFETTGAEVKNL